MSFLDFLNPIGSFINGLFNLGSTAMSNSANKQIAQQNNEMAYRMFQEGNQFTAQQAREAMDFNRQQMLDTFSFNKSEREASQQFNLDMWQKQNSYNSPAAQAERLRVAGMNPSNVLQGADTAGSVQSTPSAGSPATASGGSSTGVPGLSTPTMQSVYDPNVIPATMQAFAQAEKLRAEAKGEQIDNETRAVKNKATVDNMIADTKKKLSERDLDKQQIKNLRKQLAGLEIANMRADFAMRHDQIVEDRAAATHDAMLRQMEDQHRRALLDERTQELMNHLAVKRDSREAQRLQADLKKISEEINLMVSQKGFVDSQQLTEIAKRRGINLDNIAKDFENKDTEWHWKRSAGMRSKVMDSHLNGDGWSKVDNVLFYLVDVLGVPIKGAFKR